MRLRVSLIALVLVAAACGNDATTDTDASGGASTIAEPEEATTTSPPAAVAGGAGVSQTGFPFPPAPVVPDGATDAALAADLDAVAASLASEADIAAIERIGTHGDARAAWFLSDILRFIPFGDVADAAVGSFEQLTGADISSDDLTSRSPWQSVTNHLFAWDLPALPDYVNWKRVPFEIIEPKWTPFFDDADSDIDWRYLSWGGVLIDDRVFGDQLGCPGGCIPALDDPGVTDAAGGNWYPDDAVVFGVTIDGEARAYPKNIMEVHEMINDEIAGRRIAIPYCTLCGSAQAYYTDNVPRHTEPLVFRTSGLLTRSNKVMYELGTFSVFDTFIGTALSGPLRAEGVALEQVAVVTSTWADWREAHPETTIVAQDGGINRFYPSDPLGGRDADGPIFPVGDVDPRFPAQTQVLGVVAPDGTPVAFPVAASRSALDAGETVELAGVVLAADGGGLRALTAAGDELPSHQSFWFAWSQFQPETVVWTPLG
jgi:hypothetical protein